MELNNPSNIIKCDNYSYLCHTICPLSNIQDTTSQCTVQMCKWNAIFQPKG